MIQSVQGISNTLLNAQEKEKQILGTNDQVFSDALAAAKNLIQQTAEAEKIGTEKTYDFMTGKDENIHNLLIAQEKSSILLQFTMQVRNNVLEAYKEIMRMPV